MHQTGGVQVAVGEALLLCAASGSAAASMAESCRVLSTGGSVEVHRSKARDDRVSRRSWPLCPDAICALKLAATSSDVCRSAIIAEAELNVAMEELTTVLRQSSTVED